MNCEQTELLIGDAIYGELRPDLEQALDKHLAKCADCGRLHHELSEAQRELAGHGLTGGTFDDIPERANLDKLFEQLEPDLNRIDAERYRQRPAPLHGFIAGAIAVAATVIISVAVVLQPSTTAPAGFPADRPQLAAAAPGQQVNPDLMNYLNQASPMLMQVANTQAGDVDQLPLSDNFIRNMASQARVLNSAETGSLTPGERKLLRDIEFLLLQVANLDEANAAEGVALLQQFLEDEGILFRIRLLELKEQSDVI